MEHVEHITSNGKSLAYIIRAAMEPNVNDVPHTARSSSSRSDSSSIRPGAKSSVMSIVLSSDTRSAPLK